eukprot:7389990-Prymnesium_polylepis.1
MKLPIEVPSARRAAHACRRPRRHARGGGDCGGGIWRGPPLTRASARPAQVGGLSALEEVNIAANKLMMIPDPAMANWASVTILSLNDNNLVRLGSLEPLKALQELRLFANNLEAMPTLCEGCPIEVMEVHKNRIETIEDDYFKKTPKLKRIIISNNALAAVPPSICDCAELQQLQAADNKLTSLPSGKPWPATLETIFLQGNAGLTALPSELAKLSSLK